MKAIIIPSILAASVVVAGMFAFIQVERASTVHTTIIASIEGDAVLADDSLTAAKIANDAIGATEIADNAIDAGAIAAGAITASEAPNLDTTVSSRASQASVDALLQLKVVSRVFSATAGTGTELKTITLSSTQFPVVIFSIYIQANKGTGTTAVSDAESIRYDKFSIGGVVVSDPPNAALISGSDTAGSERPLLSEEGGPNTENTYPLGIDSDFQLGLELDSKGIGARDPNNGFDFTVIAVVMAPPSATISLS